MKRSLLTVAMLCLALVMGAGPARGQADGVEIRDVDIEDYPKITLTVSVPDGGVAADEIQVSEDGTLLTDLEIESVKGEIGAVDVVLAIDVSASMEGEPMAAALTAARAFVEQLPPEINVGVVTFGDEASVASPMTANRNRVLEAISSLQVSGDTALYDGVAEALAAFPEEGQHNIVLLSDGADNPPPFGVDCCSTATLDDVLLGAEDAQAKIFAVGLQTGDFKAGALKALSDRSGGSYFAVTTTDLSNLYSNIATEISNQFLVSWESTAAAGAEVTLEVTAAGGSDNRLILTPKGDPGPVANPEVDDPAQADPLLEGDWGFIVILGLVFGGAFVLIFMIMGASERRKREHELARRLGADIGVSPAEAAEEVGLQWVPEPLMDVAEHFAAGERKSRIDAKLEKAGWVLRASEYIAMSFMLTILGGVIGVLLTKSILFAIAGGVIASRIPTIVLSIAANKRFDKIQAQLPDILMILASSLRAGYSFMQALDAVAKEVGGPGGQEFSRVVAEIRLGRQVDEALWDVAERVGSEDLKWAVLAVNIQRDVGGNLAELLDTVANTMRERETIRRQVKVLSAEGRLSMIILLILPFGTGGWIAVINPDYFALLYKTRPGLVMITVGALLMTLGVVWMKKVVKIDV